MLVEDAKGNVFGGVDKCTHRLGDGTDLDPNDILDMNYLLKFNTDGSIIKFRLRDEIVKDGKFAENI